MELTKLQAACIRCSRHMNLYLRELCVCDYVLPLPLTFFYQWLEVADGNIDIDACS